MNIWNILLVLSVLVSCNFMAFADKKKGDQNAYIKRTGAKYMAEIAKKEGAIPLKSGIVVEILTSNENQNAKSPNLSDSCDVTYSGTLKDGTPFDSGRTSFAPNQVIKGWTEALQLMAEGDKWRIHIPYDLAYGERGAGPKIPPFAPLVFELEIHSVKAKGKPASEARRMFEEAKADKAEL
jgi:FKBP-type peptidyl-prolyl cis-trans isomerase FklB